MSMLDNLYKISSIPAIGCNIEELQIQGLLHILRCEVKQWRSHHVVQDLGIIQSRHHMTAHAMTFMHLADHDISL